MEWRQIQVVISSWTVWFVLTTAPSSDSTVFVAQAQSTSHSSHWI